MEQPLDFNNRVKVPEQVLARQLDDEMVILDLRSETYFGLDEVGTAMWNAVTSASSIEQGYEFLLGQYDVEPQELRDDLRTLLLQLVEQRLLEI